MSGWEIDCMLEFPTRKHYPPLSLFRRMTPRASCIQGPPSSKQLASLSPSSSCGVRDYKTGWGGVGGQLHICPEPCVFVLRGIYSSLNSECWGMEHECAMWPNGHLQDTELLLLLFAGQVLLPSKSPEVVAGTRVGSCSRQMDLLTTVWSIFATAFVL